MATADLFASENTSSPPPALETEPAKAKPPESGLLVTNHLNLMYMLAAGLVMPPAGFGDKYYRDTLECFPGWIPLFLDKVPREAIESAIREAGHLRPIIIRIGLTGIAGRVIAMGDHGARELNFPDQIAEAERVLLVPAPLPTSRFESITYQAVADRRACEGDAKDFGNVPLADFKSRSSTNRSLFAKAPDIPWPPGEGPAERAVPLELPLAAGGAMAMLFLFGNRGGHAVRVCRDAFDPDGDATRPSEDHPILGGLGVWMREGVTPLPPPVDAESDRTALQRRFQSRLFWEAVARLVKWREEGRAGSAENVLLDHLAEASTSLDPRLQAGAWKLHDTLESLTGLADATASELFDRHDTALAHALTLFFLRRDCADLFDYRSDRLEEADWLAAAILFGVRDGWLGLPLRLRSHPALADAVSHRVARMSHRLAGSGLDLGEPPARLQPLRERFGDGSVWRPGEKAAALELARIEKWDCVNTRINLGPGEYRLTVKGGSTLIDLPGEPRITPEVEPVRFFALLADARLDPRTETMVRAKFRD